MKNKQSRWGIVVMFFMAFIMITSVIGFIYGDNTNQPVKYNGIKFIRKADQWSAKIAGKEAVFNYVPQDVESISFGSDAQALIRNKPMLDLTSDPNDLYTEDIALAEYNLALSLQNFNTYLRQGFVSENAYDLAVITCDNATAAVPVIYFMQSNQTQISAKGNCILAEASSSYDILRVKDRILYSLLGIME